MLDISKPLAKYFTIEKRSHHFLITDIQGRAREVIEAFAKQYIEFSFRRIQGKWKKEAQKIWASRTHDAREYRFHINQYDKFLTYLDNVGLSSNLFTVTEKSLYTPLEANYVVKSHLVPRDVQIPAIDYLCSPLPPVAKMLEAPTGSGKTMMALTACSRIGKSIVAVLKPTYIEKWVSDFVETYEINKEDILVIEGSKSLKSLLHAGMGGTLKARVVIISSRTLQNWLSDYNSMKPDIYALAGWPCPPDQMYEVINAGVRLIDEAHQEFHLGFLIDLFTHVPTSISLSATMISDNAFLTQMYELVYPKPSRYSKIPLLRYIHSYALRYRFENPRLLKFKGYGGFYNHNEFEKSILKNRAMTMSYLKLIEHMVRKHYLQDEYRPGDRCLVYCASIDMCSVVTKYLEQCLSASSVSNKPFDVRRYVEDDPYDNLMSADLAVSTIQSAGTGHDISSLTTVIMTHAISSSQSNIQGFGRLRNISNRKMKFVYLVCLDIDKQIQYHREKSDLLKKRALTHQEMDYMSILRCS